MFITPEEQTREKRSTCQRTTNHAGNPVCRTELKSHGARSDTGQFTPKHTNVYTTVFTCTFQSENVKPLLQPTWSRAAMEIQQNIDNTLLHVRVCCTDIPVCAGWGVRCCQGHLGSHPVTTTFLTIAPDHGKTSEEKGKEARDHLRSPRALRRLQQITEQLEVRLY